MEGAHNQRLSEYGGCVMHLPASRPEHTPDRPSWDCRACGKDWPCHPAREHLKAEAAQDGAGGPTRLAMQMWTRLEEFSLDVGPEPPKAAFERFIAWTR